MLITSKTKMAACEMCHFVFPLDFIDEVRIVVPGNAGGREHYCANHKVPYDTKTTTSGYPRYYFQDKELVRMVGK